MIPIELTVRGITVLKDICVDFSKITGDVIAITGRNGQGKTSLIESIFLSLYRSFPSRQSGVYTYCHGKDTMIDYKFDWHGQIYEAVININAIGSKMEAFLYDENRNALPGITGLTGPFDEIVEKTFGASDMILASSFAAQNGHGNFIKIKKAERKSLFISMLNQEILQNLTKEFSARLGITEKELEIKRGELEILRNQLKESIPDIKGLKIKLEEIKGTLSNTNNHISELIEYKGRLVVQAESASKLKKSIDDTAASIVSGKAKLANIQRRATEARTLIHKAEDIRSNIKALEEARTELERLRKEIGKNTADRMVHLEQKQQYDQQTAQLREKYVAQQTSMKSAEKDKQDAIRDSATIDEVPCKAEGDYAKCPFLTRSVENRDKIPEFDVLILNCKQNMLKIKDEQKEIPRPKLEIIENLTAQINENESKVTAVEKQIKILEPNSKESAISEAETILKEMEKQELEVEETIAGLETNATSLEKEFQVSSKSLTEMETVNSSLHSLHKTRDEYEEAIDALKKQITEAETIKEAISTRKDMVKPLEEKVKELEQDRKEWKLLVEAFGPKGIQSLEIDAAGPTVSQHANDLLYSCFGPRFSIKFATQALRADGKGFKDEFDIIVVDSENGREGSIDDLSGGEKVIVAETVGCAVAIFNKMKSGIAWETLFRDEVSGPLDDVVAPRYITMLRKAKEIGHFKKVCFIAHQPRLHDLADARINMTAGQPEIIQ